MHFVPWFSRGGLVSSSWVNCSFAPYITSKCLCGESCDLLGRGCTYLRRTFLCTHSWRCGSFDWCACHCNPMQGRFLRISPLPSWWWSRSSDQWSWEDVGRVVSPHILCRIHQQLRKIKWGATYGSRGQVLWLPCSIPPSQDVCAGGHYRVCLIVVSHSNHVESQNKSIHTGLIVWDNILQFIMVGYLRILCAHTRIAPSGFGGISF